jgi:hypothetical protein
MGKREGARTITYSCTHVFNRNITIYVIIYTHPQHLKNRQENKCTPRLRSSVHIHQQGHCWRIRMGNETLRKTILAHQCRWNTKWRKSQGNNLDTLRVGHGYRKTCGFSRTGGAGTGTVSDFGTPQHTAYLYRGVMGIHRSCHTVTQPNMVLPATRSLLPTLASTPFHIKNTW